MCYCLYLSRLSVCACLPACLYVICVLLSWVLIFVPYCYAQKPLPFACFPLPFFSVPPPPLHSSPHLPFHVPVSSPSLPTAPSPSSTFLSPSLPPSYLPSSSHAFSPSCSLKVTPSPFRCLPQRFNPTSTLSYVYLLAGLPRNYRAAFPVR